MKFRARFHRVSVFPGPPVRDLLPVSDGVVLRTAGGTQLAEGGRERTWLALWDTGSPISIIPWEFVRRIGLQPVNYTLRPVRAFDGAGTRQPWFAVAIGVPELPIQIVRALAPLDADPDRPRKCITLGRDLIARLILSCASDVGWNDPAQPDEDSGWVWDYRLPTAPRSARSPG